ncbi:hypothetical protein [Nocardia sp. NPDC051981]|uniref:hypothetical protein n=1 Tax=Nocardia sp. NPDC051981 TaxID=3155417 RepID=UPI003412A37D
MALEQSNMHDNQSKNPRKDLRFPVVFEEFFALGLYQMGPVRPDTEYSGVPDRPGPQKRDPVTGALVWKIAVTDPGEANAKRASYDLLLLADTEPVPTTPELAPGMRPIQLSGVTVQPRVGGQGEYRYQAYTVRATGYAPAPSPRANSAAGGGSGKSPA